MIREDRSLFDMSLMISRTITACHLFADGNGRTAKTLFFLTFSPGYKPDLIVEGITNSDKYYSFMVNGNSFGGHIAKLVKEEFSLDSGTPIDAPNDVRVAFVRKGMDIITNNNKPENTLTFANGEQENALVALKKYLVSCVEENLESIAEDYGAGSSKYKTYEILVNEFRKNL